MQPFHALVVDEDSRLAAQLEALLQDANFKVTVAGKAWDGLLLMGLLEADPSRTPLVPDLVVIESALSDRMGFEVVGRMRQAEHTREVPVILLSKQGAAVPEFAVFDANACLKKPFGLDAFMSAVIKVLRLE